MKSADMCALSETSPWSVGSIVPVDSWVRRTWNSTPWSYWLNCYHGTKSACSLLSQPGEKQNIYDYLNLSNGENKHVRLSLPE